MKTNLLKTGVIAILMLSASVGYAQKTTGDLGAGEKNGHSKVLNGTIRVIDNKGTKKYLQVQNGLTLLTDATPDGGIVSTWQLGGSITDNTYIDATGKVFSLDGLKLVPSTTAAATASTTQSIGSNAQGISGQGTAASETGWTVLIRDEASGEIQKLLVSDLVKGGQMTSTSTADDAQPSAPAALTDVSIPMEYHKVWVYRNGAKLIANKDYTIGAGGVITIVPNATAPNDWKIYKDDEFEVHWIN